MRTLNLRLVNLVFAAPVARTITAEAELRGIRGLDEEVPLAALDGAAARFEPGSHQRKTIEIYAETMRGKAAAGEAPTVDVPLTAKEAALLHRRPAAPTAMVDRAMVEAGVKGRGLPLHALGDAPVAAPGVVVIDRLDDNVKSALKAMSADKTMSLVAIVTSPGLLEGGGVRDLLRSGASEVLAWDPAHPQVALDGASDQLAVVAKREQAIRVPALAEQLVGESAAWKAVLGAVVDAAASHQNVVVAGEPGTGKSGVARALHSLAEGSGALVVFDARTEKPERELYGWVRGALPDALSSRAGLLAGVEEGGTLFLEDVDRLSLEMQRQLNEILDRGSFQAIGSDRQQPLKPGRIVASTTKELRREVEEGRFDRDLYYRLAGRSIELPPLSARADDIPLLVEHFVKAATPQGNEPPTVDPALMTYLVDRAYADNVQELEALVTRIVKANRDKARLSASAVADDG